jgi:protein-S-isoprenylcysteine O-methyltransferase Ste14
MSCLNFQSVDSIRSLTIHLWQLLGIVWLVGAFLVKPTAIRHSSKARFWYLLILVVAGYLIFGRHMDISWLNMAIFSVNTVIARTGLAVTCIGIAFCIWARLILGGNWSGAVTIKQDHTLVQSGPYSIVRHPIYTGLLIALTGTAIQYGYVRSFLGVLLAGFGFWLKSLIEEQFMAQRFGHRYLVYRQRVSALIPFIF